MRTDSHRPFKASRLLAAAVLLALAIQYVPVGIFPNGPAFAAGADDFIITVKTDNDGPSGDHQFMIPASSASPYNYNVDCNNDGTLEFTGAVGVVVCDYTALGGSGTYMVRIEDNVGDGTGFPQLFFNDAGDRQKITDINQWGTLRWVAMNGAFKGTNNLVNYSATDVPDLSGVTDMSEMFSSSFFNGAIDSWDVSTVTNFEGMFHDNIMFNQPLGSWDTRAAENMSDMFFRARTFNQDISGWEIPNLVDVVAMFRDADLFNQDLRTDPTGGNRGGTAWDVSGLDTLTSMFNGAHAFNGDITNWDVSNVTIFASMFALADAFNQDITGWDVSSGNNFSSMFSGTDIFNQDISVWDMTAASNLSAMFRNSTAFNQPIGAWDVRTVSRFDNMFNAAQAFNQDIGDWQIDNALNLTGMFREADAFQQDISFSAGGGNQGGDAWDLDGVKRIDFMFADRSNVALGISNWDTSTVEDMTGTFENTPGAIDDITGWDTSSADEMDQMFHDAVTFNQDISSWNTSAVTTMSSMFEDADAFNQDISTAAGWDTGVVEDMSGMFNGADVFNQDISDWNTGTVTTMADMFNTTAVFNQSLGAWNVANVTDMTNMLSNSALSTANYDNTLTGWSIQTVQNVVPLGADGLSYNLGGEERQILTGNFDWVITGDAHITNVTAVDDAYDVFGGVTAVRDPRSNDSSTGGALTATQIIDVNDGDYTTYLVALGGSVTLLSGTVVSLRGDGMLNITPAIIPGGGVETFDYMVTDTADTSNRATITLNIEEVGMNMSRSSSTLDENADTDTYTIELNAEPTGTVVVDLFSTDTNEVTVAPASLTFTTATWDTPQTVTITAVDDSLVRLDTATVTARVNDAASADEYDGVSDVHHEVVLVNDDTPSVVIGPAGIIATGILLDEAAGTSSVAVKLGTQPLTDVVVDFFSGDTNEATASPLALTFTNANWDTDQYVIVTAVEDGFDRNDSTTFTIDVDDAASDDTYDPVPPTATTITIIDNDVSPAAPTINTPTNGNPVTGTGVIGATVTVYAPSGASCTATVLGGGSWSCVLAPAPTNGELLEASQADAFGNTSPTTTALSAVDTTVPTVTINQAATQSDPVSSFPVQFTVVFSEPIATSTFTTADIATGLSTAPGATVLSVVEAAPNDGTTFAVTITANGDGVVEATVPAGGVEDLVGNTNAVSTAVDNQVTFDTALDTDGDGVTDIIEAIIGTDPTDTDTDGDGTDDSNNDLDNIDPVVELDANNNGDGNGDGILDARQNAVASTPNVATGRFNSLDITSSGVGTCEQIARFMSVQEASLAAQDSNFDYTLGLWDFTIDCTNPGDTAEIEIYLNEVIDTDDFTYRKFNAGTDTYTDITNQVTFSTETVGATPVTVIAYSVVDGGPLDSDGVANGQIVDPSGLARSIGTVDNTPVNTGGSSSSGSKVKRVCRDESAINYQPNGRHTQSLCEYDKASEIAQEITSQTALQCPYFTEYLRVGDTGSDVVAVQAFMGIKGYYKNDLTGVFDEALAGAVREFQNDNWETILKPWGIALGGATGYLYQSTRARMNVLAGCDVCVTLDNGQRVGCDDTAVTPVVPVVPVAPVSRGASCNLAPARPGDDDDNVYRIQQFLNSLGFMDFAPTGYYGPITEAAVRDYQAAYPEIYQGIGLTAPTTLFYSRSVNQAKALCEASEDAS